MIDKYGVANGIKYVRQDGKDREEPSVGDDFLLLYAGKRFYDQAIEQDMQSEIYKCRDKRCVGKRNIQHIGYHNDTTQIYEHRDGIIPGFYDLHIYEHKYDLRNDLDNRREYYL